MEQLSEFLVWLQELHSADGISHLVRVGGIAVLAFIVFAETGLLVGFFLPGDSLLITAGVLANPENQYHIPSLSMGLLNATLIFAAIIGDQTGFFLGRKAGLRVWNKSDGRFFKRKHLEQASAFYEKYGGLAIVGGHYVPIMRTFVPFVAGMAQMPYRKFAMWNVSGGILWITSLLWLGYYLGQTSLADRLDKLILIVIAVSISPAAIGAFRRWKSSVSPRQ